MSCVARKDRGKRALRSHVVEEWCVNMLHLCDNMRGRRFVCRPFDTIPFDLLYGFVWAPPMSKTTWFCMAINQLTLNCPRIGDQFCFIMMVKYGKV